MAGKKINRGTILSNKITRKVISRASSAEKVSKEAEVSNVSKVVEETGRSKRACFFCQSKTSPSYTDVSVLRRFLSDRAKIVSRAKNNLCSKHQRVVSKQIKYARHLALLPFVPRV